MSFSYDTSSIPVARVPPSDGQMVALRRKVAELEAENDRLRHTLDTLGGEVRRLTRPMTYRLCRADVRNLASGDPVKIGDVTIEVGP